jgi:hypothetical protein
VDGHQLGKSEKTGKISPKNQRALKNAKYFILSFKFKYKLTTSLNNNIANLPHKYEKTKFSPSHHARTIFSFPKLQAASKKMQNEP